MDAFLIAAVAVAMGIGVIGTVLPFVPGLPVAWAAALVYGLFADTGAAGWAFFALITVVFGLGMLAGIVLPKRRLDSVGAPRSTMMAGVLLGLIGLFVVPVVGLPLGAALGVFLAERGRLGSWEEAWRSTRQVLIGLGAGALVQAGAGLVMLLVWIAWVVVL